MAAYGPEISISERVVPLSEILARVPLRKEGDTLEAEVRVEAKKLQRDQRYAAAMNIVTQARLHSGRSAEVATPSDAATVNLIFTLLQAVANEPVPEPDKIFTNIPGHTTNSFMELVVSLCAKPKGDEAPPSNEQHD